MEKRNEMLFNLYRECFYDDFIKNAFEENWRYIYTLLKEDQEDKVSDNVLIEITEWLNSLL